MPCALHVACALLCGFGIEQHLPQIRRRLVLSSAGSILVAPLARSLSMPLPARAAAATSEGPASPTLYEEKRALIALIPAMPYGAPATNVTISVDISTRIDHAAASFEARTAARNLAREGQLNGSWRLLYSNSAEITSLAKGLPLGLQLGPVYQPLDLSRHAFENQGMIVHALKLASGGTRVVGDLRSALPDTLNAAGVKNDSGNRIEVDFRRVEFSLDHVLSVPVRVSKVLAPKPNPEAAPPAIDITFLDQEVRVTRGGDGALFVLRREESSTPMLDQAARDALLEEDGDSVVVGAGLRNWSIEAGLGVLSRAS